MVSIGYMAHSKTILLWLVLCYDVYFSRYCIYLRFCGKKLQILLIFFYIFLYYIPFNDMLIASQMQFSTPWKSNLLMPWILFYAQWMILNCLIFLNKLAHIGVISSSSFALFINVQRFRPLNHEIIQVTPMQCNRDSVIFALTCINIGCNVIMSERCQTA